MWDAFVSLVERRDNVSKSRAIDIALADPTGRELWTVAKMGPAAEFEWQADSTHGVTPNPETPHTEHHETGDAALSRYRQEHGRKALKQFNDHCDALVAQGMTRSEAQDHTMKTHPELWQQAKLGKFEPPSHDGNALRGSTPEGVDYGNRSVSRRGQRPYGQA
jgi:hypothetical protein